MHVHCTCLTIAAGVQKCVLYPVLFKHICTQSVRPRQPCFSYNLFNAEEKTCSVNFMVNEYSHFSNRWPLCNIVIEPTFSTSKNLFRWTPHWPQKFTCFVNNNSHFWSDWLKMVPACKKTTFLSAEKREKDILKNVKAVLFHILLLCYEIIYLQDSKVWSKWS